MSEVNSYVAEVMDAVQSTRIVAILRGDMKHRAAEIIRILLDSGIRVLEITTNSPRAFETIAIANQEFAGEVVIGVGTVTHAEHVAQARSAGAKFIVSPNTDQRVIEATLIAGMASFPGAFTCSEVMGAFDAGAHAVKLFPMVDASPKLVRALRAPLGDVRLLPTGGITVCNAAEYLEAGAWALGVGSDLVSADTANDPRLERLRATATRFVAATMPFRQQAER